MTIWAALWRSKNRRDGITKHFLYVDCLPALFKTRRECREFIEEKYGYISTRPDLQEEPHGWQKPTPVKVKIIREG